MPNICEIYMYNIYSIYGKMFYQSVQQFTESERESGIHFGNLSKIQPLKKRKYVLLTSICSHKQQITNMLLVDLCILVYWYRGQNFRLLFIGKYPF